MKKVAVVLSEGFEEIEALTVVDILRRGNIDCKMIGLNSKMVTGSHGIRVQTDAILGLEIVEYDMIVLPGGMPGAANLRDSNTLKEIVIKMYDANKKIAAICAAPIALEKFELLNGKKVTSYPNSLVDESKMLYKEDNVVVDNNIITSRGPATAMEFSYRILKELGYENEAKKLEKGMLYKI